MSKLKTGQLEILRLGMLDELRCSNEARFFLRLFCLVMIARGYSYKEIAECFELEHNTVAQWVRHFQNFGIEGLKGDRVSRRPTDLDHEQINKLTLDLRRTPLVFGYHQYHWDEKLLASHLQRKYSVSLSMRQCQRLLRQLLPQSQ